MIGGEDVKSEKEKIRKGINVVIGTPGKILYHMKNTRGLYMGGVESIVYEEADMILQLGFEKDLGEILDLVNEQAKNYQNILVSAIVNEKLENMIKKIVGSKDYKAEEGALELLQNNFEVIGVEGSINKLVTPVHLNHFYSIIDQRNKVSFFLTLLKLLENKKVIVFVSTADQVNFLNEICNMILSPNFDYETEKTKLFIQKILKIHGHMEQKDRTKVFIEFNESETGVLFCTDVAARGLDFQSVEFIILFDVSASYREYINRVGRTARAEHIGACLSLLYEEELPYAKKLEENCNAKEIKYFRIEKAF